MDLHEVVELRQGKKTIELPLINVLRFSIIHLTQLRAEWHMETGESNIQDFWIWLEKRLGMGPGKKVLI